MNDKAFMGIVDLDHNPELAKALGDMTVSWSAAESALQSVLHKATSLSYEMTTSIFFRCPTFESRINMMRSLVEAWDTKKYDTSKLLEAIDTLSSLSKTRNAWIHGRWAVSMDRKRTYIFQMRAAPGKRKKQVNAHSVRQHVIALHKAIELIVDNTHD